MKSACGNRDAPIPMWSFFESFDDPRWRQERRFLCIFVPIILLVTAVSLTVLLWEKLFPVPEPPIAMSAIPSVHSVQPPPSTPEPTDPSSPTDLTRGEAALKRGDLASARIFLSKALTQEESKSQAYSALGSLEVLEKNPEQAVLNFTAAIALDDKNPSSFYHRSEILRRAERHEEALADLRKANALDPANPLYTNKILLARLESGDKEAVFREMKAILELNLSTGQANWLAGAAAIEIESGNTQRALGYLHMLRPLVPEASFQMIVSDRFFDRYRETAEFSRLIPPEEVR